MNRKSYKLAKAAKAGVSAVKSVLRVASQCKSLNERAVVLISILIVLLFIATNLLRAQPIELLTIKHIDSDFGVKIRSWLSKLKIT